MGVIETMREVAGLVQKLDNIELHRRIIELQSQLLDLISTNTELTEANKKLQERLGFQESLVFDPSANVYWSGPEGAREGPFCTKCWDADGKAVRLHELSGGGWYCPTCQVSIIDPKERPFSSDPPEGGFY